MRPAWKQILDGTEVLRGDFEIVGALPYAVSNVGTTGSD